MPYNPPGRARRHWRTSPQGVRPIRSLIMSSSALPYPPSPALALTAVTEQTTRRDDLDGDNWPLTWAADGALYAAYGDGWGCRPLAPDTKRNSGLVRLVGPAEDCRS